MTYQEEMEMREEREGLRAMPNETGKTSSEFWFHTKSVLAGLACFALFIGVAVLLNTFDWLRLLLVVGLVLSFILMLAWSIGWKVVMWWERRP